MNCIVPVLQGEKGETGESGDRGLPGRTVSAYHNTLLIIIMLVFPQYIVDNRNVDYKLLVKGYRSQSKKIHHHHPDVPVVQANTIDLRIIKSMANTHYTHSRASSKLNILQNSFCAKNEMR